MDLARSTRRRRRHWRSGKDPDRERDQITESLTCYGPIEYFWVDHAIGTGGLSHADFLAQCATLQPDCLVGFNHGDQAGTVLRIGEGGHPAPLDRIDSAGPYADPTTHTKYLAAEFTYPILPPHEGGANWFYSLPAHDNLFHPAEKIADDYAGAVAFDNLFSLAVAPAPNGRLRDIDTRTLRKVGQLITERRS